MFWNLFPVGDHQFVFGFHILSWRVMLCVIVIIILICILVTFYINVDWKYIWSERLGLKSSLGSDSFCDIGIENMMQVLQQMSVHSIPMSFSFT